MLVNAVRRMPASLVVLFFVFLVVPLWSKSFLDWPWEIAREQGLGLAALVTLTYWVGPLLICLTMVLRSFALLPIFALECLGLIVHSIMNIAGQPTEIQMVRYALLGVMSIIGFIVINKDVLYPVISRQDRFWRRGTRVYANQKVRVILPDSKESAPALMQDCSLTGIGLLADRGRASEILATKRKGDKVQLEIGRGDQQVLVDGEIIWFKDDSETRHIGLAVFDSDAMGKVIANLDSVRSGKGFNATITKLWVKSGFRRAAISAWALSVAGSFGMPACGTDRKHNNRSSETTVDQNRGVDPRRTEVSGSHGFGLTFDGPQVSNGTALAYTGRSLSYTNCDGNSGSLTEDVSQDRLLQFFQGQQNWWDQAISSLEESDRDGLVRPKVAVHTRFKERLGNATDPRLWDLNLIRFRLGDTPHIKFNYEADVWAANTNDSIGFAAFIHGIAIPKARSQEFVNDLNAIPRDENLAGCALKRIVDKWVLGAGSYWFAHTNVLDLARNEWIWTELKVVMGDLSPVNTGCSNAATCGPMSGTTDDSDGDGVPDHSDMCQDSGALGQVDGFGCPMMTSEISDPMPMDSSEPEPTASPSPMMSGFALTSSARQIVGMMESPASTNNPDRTLRIVPMLFKKFVWDPAANTTVLKGSADDVAMWMSGSKTDAAIDLVSGPNGEILEMNHPARANELTFTCAGCHIRQTLAGPWFGIPGNELEPTRSMEFRHVGYGTGAGRIFGVSRPDNRANMSPYLRDLAFVRVNKATITGAAEPRLFGYFGNEATAPSACSPWNQCKCDDHQDFKFCIEDAAAIPDMEAAYFNIPILKFPDIVADSKIHAEACSIAAEMGGISGTQCDFLRCVATEAASGASLSVRRFEQTYNDPTFSCQLDTKVRPKR